MKTIKMTLVALAIAASATSAFAAGNGSSHEENFAASTASYNQTGAGMAIFGTVQQNDASIMLQSQHDQHSIGAN